MTGPGKNLYNRREDPNAIRRRRIGELLVDANVISQTQLNEALRIQEEKGGRVVNALIMLGHLTPQQFIHFLAKQPGVAGIEISNCGISRELIALVPKKFATEHEVFPIDKLGKLLTIGMVCPLDTGTIQELETLTGLRVKPLLCSPDDIRMAINKYYPSDLPYSEMDKDTGKTGASIAAAAAASAAAQAMPEAMDDFAGSLKLGSIVTLIRQINSLPALPETVQRVREAMSSPNVSVASVGKLIAGDPPVAARILSVANSALYGFAHRVNSLDLAVSLMGLRETYAIVLSMSVINLLESAKKPHYKKYWETSLFAADAGNSLYRLYSEAGGTTLSRGALFSACLLQDIGRLALTEVSPKLYAMVSQTANGHELLQSEEKVVGLTHQEAGFELASHWSLPPDISNAIRFHHNPERAGEFSEIVAFVALSDGIVRMHAGEGVEMFKEIEPSLQILNISREHFMSAMEDFVETRGALASSLLNA